MTKNYLSRLGTLTHAERTALAVAGLVFFDQINQGRLVVRSAADERPDVDDIDRADTTALIETGYEFQDAINSGDDAALFVFLTKFCLIAERGQS